MSSKPPVTIINAHSKHASIKTGRPASSSGRITGENCPPGRCRANASVAGPARSAMGKHLAAEPSMSIHRSHARAETAPDTVIATASQTTSSSTITASTSARINRPRRAGTGSVKLMATLTQRVRRPPDNSAQIATWPHLPRDRDPDQQTILVCVQKRQVAKRSVLGCILNYSQVIDPGEAGASTGNDARTCP